jgi:hypothetical protein
MSNSTIAASVTNLTPFVVTSGGNQEFGLAFNALAHNSFSVWASSNFTTWSWLGAVSEPSAGQYQFFDPASNSAPCGFYRLSVP